MRELTSMRKLIAFTLALIVALAITKSVAPVMGEISAGNALITRDSAENSVKIAPAHRQSVNRGMDWLLSVQRGNGMVGGDIGQPVDLSCTAMLGMALLAEGNTLHGGPHSRELARTLEAVLTLVEGLPAEPKEPIEVTLVQRKIGLYADRFLTALFLGEIHGESGPYDEEVRSALERLTNDISRAQGKDGTWGSKSWAPVLGTVLGWESLRSSASCGLRVDASAQLAGEALLAMLRRDLQQQDSWMHEFYKKASSIRVLYSLNYRDDPAFLDCLRQTIHFAQSDRRPFVQAGGEEFLAFFLITECLMHESRGAGPEWYGIVSDRLVEVQNADGSWTGHHCIVNRTFCTAAALLTLQAPNNCLSISNF